MSEPSEIHFFYTLKNDDSNSLSYILKSYDADRPSYILDPMTVIGVTGHKGLHSSQSTPSVLLVPHHHSTPESAPELAPEARTEADWLNSVAVFLPKSMREALLGDLLEERATWRAEGRSRLSVARWTVSQLTLSALAVAWSAAKDLLVDFVKRWLGF